MIFKFHVNRDVRKTMDYVLGPGTGNEPGRAVVLGGQGFGFEPKTDEDVKLAVGMMHYNGDPRLQTSPTKKCGLTGGHGILSWHPGQEADPDEMLNAGRHFLKTLGMEGSMAVFTRHNDKDHPHMHIGVSMIDPRTGLTYDRYQFVHRGQHIAVQWERDNDRIPPSRQRDHDRADAARKLDYPGIKRLLEEDGGKLTHREIDRTLTLGGHFGRHLGAVRAGFRKYLEEEPDRTRTQERPEPRQERPSEPRRPANPDPEPVGRGWPEPPKPDRPRKPIEPTEQPVSVDRRLLRDGMRDADDPHRRKFVERLKRSHEQYGSLTPGMRVALGGEPGRFRESPEPTPPRQPEPERPKTDEPKIKRDLPHEPQQEPKREPAPQMSAGATPQRGSPGTGNLEDRTDQTAEGRRYIKRQRGRER